MTSEKTDKRDKPQAILPNGFIDIKENELALINGYSKKIAGVYHHYGFAALETPIIEYSSSLGSFLPDQDRPNAGVFTFSDGGSGNALSLRYDLTAPLARYVSENFQHLPKPFRSYRYGYVFRNEKPGPGRLRQFMQIDADTVGSQHISCDAELCMMMADCLTTIGFKNSDYVIKINNRKLLDGLLGQLDINDDDQKLIIMRAIDKLDRLGLSSVEALLTDGRMDESGDFTKGAGLSHEQATRVIAFLTARGKDNDTTLANLAPVVSATDQGKQGLHELALMGELMATAGYDDARMLFDPSIVRGLAYYTGTVFEAELTLELANDKGKVVNFGALASGGRYNDLIARFMPETIPASGCSFGLSRLIAMSRLIPATKAKIKPPAGPVLVTTMIKDNMSHYYRLVSILRQAGIRAELYLGSSGIRAQMKYADRRDCPCVVIQGSDELAENVVQIKDLVRGSEMAKNISDNLTWRSERPAQQQVSEQDMVATIKAILCEQKRELEL